MLSPAVNSRGSLKFPAIAHAAFYLHCHFDGRQRSPEIPPQWRTRHSTSTVISTEAQRSGEISLLNSMCGIEAGDLSTQSLNSADTSLAIPACIPARDDRAAGSVKHKAFPPYTRHPERQRRISVSMVSEGKGSQYQWAGRRVPGPGMTGSRAIHGMFRDSSPAAQNDRRGGKEARVDTGDVLSCRQFKGSPEIPPQWRTRYSTSTVISTVGSGVEKSHSSIACAALRREISRLRVSIVPIPLSPSRHAAPLEMTGRRAASKIKPSRLTHVILSASEGSR